MVSNNTALLTDPSATRLKKGQYVTRVFFWFVPGINF